MKRREIVRIFGGTIIAQALIPRNALAHHVRHHHWHPPILPHVRPMPHRSQAVEVKSIDVHVKINGRLAITTMTMDLHNPGRRQQEAEVMIPISSKAMIRQFGMEGAQGKFPAQLIAREEARRIYDEVVSKILDPALLEFAGSGLVKSSVFPVPAGGNVKIQLVYEELLEMDGERIDYRLLRTESPLYKVPWSVKIDWKIPEGISAIYSPSHDFKEKRLNAKRVELVNQGVMQPGSLLLSAMQKKGNVASASMIAYPSSKKNEGYFLLLLSPPERKEELAVKREVTLVMDKSGSMAGEKMDQALNAASQVIEGLNDGEFFNVIVYNEAVEKFRNHPVKKTKKSLLDLRGYLKNIRVSGGTNIHDALSEAVQQPVNQGVLPLILFLTDGVPTIGQTQEKKIRESIQKQNTQHRRIFTFGVGVDVNTPLLSRLADDSRARPTYVLPKENVELKVAKVFRQLKGPVLSEPTLTTKGNIVSDVLPSRLPDMFSGEQMIILGRYHTNKQLRFNLTGQDVSGERSFDFNLSLKKSSRRNAHVPRLWATRKIALLTEALRDLGAEYGSKVDMNDAKIKELIDEIVRLSTKHGVLTEYTAFLAKDGLMFTPQVHHHANLRASSEFEQKAVKKRSGAASMNQDWNIARGKSAQKLNRNNYYLNDELKRDEVADVQQFADKSFFRKGREWVDADLVGKELKDEKVITVNVSSPEFQKIVTRLVKEHRQSCLALGENIRVVIDQETYLIQSGK